MVRSAIVRARVFRQVGLDKTLCNKGSCGANRRVARHVGTSGSALLLISASYVSCFEVVLFTVLYKSVNNICKLNLALQTSKSEISYEYENGNVFQWSMAVLHI